ncbi:MAG: DUF2207 domain-containing protein, partial [Oscillospiraceae bacterium]
MKKVTKKVFCCFTACLFAFCLFSPMTLAAENYEITGFNVEINVDENNIYHVKENISTNFTTSSHGIYRTIPYSGKMQMPDGDEKIEYFYENVITNINCNESFSVDEGQSGIIAYSEIRIGDKDEYVLGKKNYAITYDYAVKDDDHTENFD